MFTVCSSIEIAKPCDAVYDYLVEPSNWPRWVSDVKSVDARTPMKEGDVFHEVVLFRGEEKRSRGEVLESEPGRRLVLKVVEVLSGPQLLPVRRLELSPTAGGTRLDWTSDVEVRGMMWLLQPLLPSMFRKKKADYLAALKRELESSAA